MPGLRPASHMTCNRRLLEKHGRGVGETTWAFLSLSAKREHFFNQVSLDWRLKALLQLAFSLVPRGERLNYFVQRYWTKSLPPSDSSFAATVNYAKRHIDAILRYCHWPLAQATFYEFGAGWDMTIPLAFYSLGVETQIVVDIRSLIRLPILNNTIDKYQRMAAQLGLPRIPADHLDYVRDSLVAALKRHYGIDYLAPCDARHTGLPTSSIDCISSTDTLEHIPPEDIAKILQECHRILSEDGVLSFVIDYDDHYSYFDPKISKYNFLRYSDHRWALFNPSLHYQNRLRHRDYIRLLETAGFDVLEDQHKDASDLEMNILSQLSLAKRFKSYSVRELAVHNALIVARKGAARAG